jgi:hypothetical protein
MRAVGVPDVRGDEWRLQAGPEPAAMDDAAGGEVALNQAGQAMVCGQIGILSGSVVEIFDVDDVVVDGETGSDVVLTEMALRTQSFRCPFCTLQRHGPDELTAAP